MRDAHRRPAVRSQRRLRGSVGQDCQGPRHRLPVGRVGEIATHDVRLGAGQQRAQEDLAPAGWLQHPSASAEDEGMVGRQPQALVDEHDRSGVDLAIWCRQAVRLDAQEVVLAHPPIVS
jgi:hypothetical protein